MSDKAKIQNCETLLNTLVLVDLYEMVFKLGTLSKIVAHTIIMLHLDCGKLNGRVSMTIS